MTDRELLELAAKAAGYEIEVDQHDVIYYHEGSGPQSWAIWTPLTCDGDALRMAVKLFLHIHVYDGFTEAQGDYRPLGEEHYDDPSAATRRAIVRAAAEIGRGMK